MINFVAGVTVSTGQVGSLEERKDELWVAAPNTTLSTLVIHQTRQSHAGNYTCAPPHATKDTVRLYVAQGELSMLIDIKVLSFRVSTVISTSRILKSQLKQSLY